MTALGMPQVGAIEGIAALICPEEVNRALHKIAIEMGGGLLRPSFNQKIEIPDVGAPRLPAAVPKVEKLSKRRLRGKQTVNAASSSSAASFPDFHMSELHAPLIERAACRARVNPTLKSVVSQTTFTEAEQDSMNKLPKELRKREQKRLLHNRVAAEKNWHVLNPFEGFATSTTCSVCSQIVDLTGTKKPSGDGHFITWHRAVAKCSTHDDPRRSVGAMIRERSIKIEEMNKMFWNVSPKHHIYFLLTEQNPDLVKCQRCEKIFKRKDFCITALRLGVCKAGFLPEEMDGTSYSSKFAEDE